jgi:hypothetical protein
MRLEVVNMKKTKAKKIMLCKKENKAGIIGDIVADGILTPQRVEELFFKALGDVLNENKKGDKNG